MGYFNSAERGQKMGCEIHKKAEEKGLSRFLGRQKLCPKTFLYETLDGGLGGSEMLCRGKGTKMASRGYDSRPGFIHGR